MIKPLLVILTFTNLVVILLLIWQFENTEIKHESYLPDSENNFRNLEDNVLAIGNEFSKARFEIKCTLLCFIMILKISSRV